MGSSNPGPDTPLMQPPRIWVWDAVDRKGKLFAGSTLVSPREGKRRQALFYISMATSGVGGGGGGGAALKPKRERGQKTAEELEPR